MISQKAHKSAEKMSSPSVQCLLVHLGPGLVADPVLIVALTGNTRLIREAKSTGFGARLSRQSFVFLSAGGSTRSHMSDPRLWEEKSMAAPGVQHKCEHRGRHSAVWHDRIGRVMAREGEEGKDGPCHHNGGV